MEFTFSEWKLIAQDVTIWKENSENILKECKPSDDKYSTYQIYLHQVNKLRNLENKIENSII